MYWSRYYYYTRDHELILTHLTKIAGLGQFLNQRIDLAKAAGYPQSDSRYAMPFGNDEADMFFGTVVGYNTELPFISIAAEMWRGLRDCGEALAMIAASLDSSSDSAKQAKEVSLMMLSNTVSLLANLRDSMEKDRFVQDGSVCHPCLLQTVEHSHALSICNCTGGGQDNCVSTDPSQRRFVQVRCRGACLWYALCAGQYDDVLTS